MQHPSFSPIIPEPPFIVKTDSSAARFPEINTVEMRQSWSKELVIAQLFFEEMDLYRAITAYKRALFLLPPPLLERRYQIEYQILLCYYVGEKYQDVIDQYEKSCLIGLPTEFPALQDLLIILYDSYFRVGDLEKAMALFSIIESLNPCLAEQLNLFTTISQADFFLLNHHQSPVTEGLLCSYKDGAKSVYKAQFLNAALPGAGYLYVGQKQTALTSFIINALFIAAACHFFEHKNYAAAMITSSLEFGWYFGGINGAGIAANQYNQRLYEILGKDLLTREKLFPRLMIGYNF